MTGDPVRLKLGFPDGNYLECATSSIVVSALARTCWPTGCLSTLGRIGSSTYFFWLMVI